MEYSTKELTEGTLSDFARLFNTHPAPGATRCWCTYNHRSRSLPQSLKLGPKESAARNRRLKRELVKNGCSHGIIVYENGAPVGWCQYGTSAELPRIDSDPRYQKLGRQSRGKILWRITCFVVDRKHRRRGVARAALKAVLKAIRKKGGGLVEAYPLASWNTYASFRGTISMFEDEDFKIVSSLGKSNVVMQRTI